MKKLLVLIMLIVFLLGACSKPEAGNEHKLLISAASSLSGVMEKAASEFRKTGQAVELSFNYGSSSKLRTQIEQGAPVDLFLSASEDDMELLKGQRLIQADSIVPFAKNRLVLASSADLTGERDFEALLKDAETIAVGEPESVPLGRYTKEVLEDLELWDPLDGKLVYAKDARQVLTYVESGNASLGIVYASDAATSKKITGMAEFPESREPVVYPGAIASDSKNQEAAEAFLNFLAGPEGQKLFEEFGFIPASGAGS
ncbi:molybdate ABC transporter substrate-binding protein [Planomicrobium sp. CPCC 101079]|uniref:molybdate ABC transporter substrate-binding protein n=1 Tax=Planomicrobium sp. CPCC 101079 TaxID=2599618 RepID=UPI0011B36A21|nr:molybdate ABC transporter substrate-binding protein [Planomicrobium sp. CPCC 101079]TWT01783.1 molybdate ABC transporter substrate-binding protein [Planomicrobium sp. CPCC 101079]